MMEVDAAKCIQSFYRRLVTYPKIKENGIYQPIDPIYHIPFNKERLVKIFYLNEDKYHARVFNIDSLAEWISMRKEYINPVSNLEFSSLEISQIKTALKRFEIEIVYPVEKPSSRKYKPSKEQILATKLKKKLDELMVAVKKNDLEKSRKIILENSVHILDGKMDIETRYITGFKINTGEMVKKPTMFHYAAYFGNFELLELLCYYEEYNLDLPEERQKYTPLHLACLGGHKNCANLLVTYGAKTGNLCFPTFCSENGSVEGMDIFLLGINSPEEGSREVIEMLSVISF